MLPIRGTQDCIVGPAQARLQKAAEIYASRYNQEGEPSVWVKELRSRIEKLGGRVALSSGDIAAIMLSVANHRCRLANLRWVDMSGLPITDEGLRHLSGLTGLQYLGLGNARVTDRGAATLQQSLPRLRRWR